ALSVGLPKRANDDQGLLGLGLEGIDRPESPAGVARQPDLGQPAREEAVEVASGNTFGLLAEVFRGNLLTGVSATKLIHQLKERVVADPIPERGQEQDSLARGDLVPLVASEVRGDVGKSEVRPASGDGGQVMAAGREQVERERFLLGGLQRPI